MASEIRVRILLVMFLLQLPALALLGNQKGQVSPGLRPGRADDVRAGEHLFFEAQRATTYKLSDSAHLLVLGGKVAISIGPDRCSAEEAVVWLRPSDRTVNAGGRRVYQGVLYLRGRPVVKQAEQSRTAILKHAQADAGNASVVTFQVAGGVFVRAEKRDTGDPRGLVLYGSAVSAVGTSGLDLWPWVHMPARQVSDKPQPKPQPPAKPTQVITVGKEQPSAHTVSIAPESGSPLQVELSKGSDSTEVITIIGRVYVWWQSDNTVGQQGKGVPLLLELHADNAVLWRAAQPETEQAAPALLGMTEEKVVALYVCGSVVMREGGRLMRADEVYYDFVSRQGVAANASLRSFDVSRGIPVYVKAAKLKQVAENTFQGEDISLTTSEFYTPQVSLNAGSVLITDSTAEGSDGKGGNADYDAQMRDVALRVYGKTIMRWPSVRSNLQNPDMPVKGVGAGHDSTFGTSLETRWFLARLLGLREPSGTNSTLALDYYGNRGPGAGVEISYAEDNYFGRLIGYAIHDSGEDRLGRHPTRRNLEPPNESRGRFEFQHRHFLPYGWQLSTEASYLSDENFLEQYYRNEFNVGKEQETLVHLKRIQDNWGFSLLAKSRINDFADQVEELPSAEFHWTGQSFFDNRLTFYSDNQISRFRYRYGEGVTPVDPWNFFTFASTRNEVDLPVTLGPAKIVPFVAGTLAYDDGAGFSTQLDGPAAEPQDGIWIGEAGIRATGPQFWQVYPDVNSRLLDLNQVRHVVRPHLTAVTYAQSNVVAEQRDVLSLGLSQRWQTKRGSPENQRTVDWIELDIDFVWLNHPADVPAGPDRFISNKPFIPFASRLGGVLPPRDRRSTDIFGPTRNYIGTDFIWRVSDTTAVLSDAYFDMQSGTVQQFDVGFSRLCWPNLSYYIGSRYLRQFDNGFGEKGTNALTFAATYVLDPRYTLAASQQYDFDYGANIRSDITLIRRYHRVYFALTFSADESLDQTTVSFSLWPEGVPELSVGLRRYMGLGDTGQY